MPPSSLCPSVHFTGRAGQEVQTFSALCGLVVVAITKTTECYQHCFSPRAKTQHHNRYYEENQLMIFLHMNEKLKFFGFLLEVLIRPAPRQL